MCGMMVETCANYERRGGNREVPTEKRELWNGIIWSWRERRGKSGRRRHHQGVGVSEMASMRVEETNMRVYTESEFKTEVVKCPALHRSEHRKHDEDILRHQHQRKDVSRRRMLWWRQACWIRIDDGPHMRTAKD